MSTNERIIYSQVDRPGLGLDVISTCFALHTDQVLSLARLGAIYINQKRWNPDEVPLIKEGSAIRIHLKPRRYPLEQLQKIQILADASDWIAINKPAGVPSHETLDNQIENAKAWTEKLTNTQLWSLSRLDVGTSGVLLFAKNSLAARVFFLDVLPLANKIYSFASHSPPKNLGLWTHWMRKNPRAPKEVSLEKKYETDLLCQLQVLETHPLPDGTHLTRVQLITGRTHQIRVQAQFEACSIIGDTMYGPPSASEAFAFEKWSLNCDELEFFYEGEKKSLHSSTKISPRLD